MTEFNSFFIQRKMSRRFFLFVEQNFYLQNKICNKRKRLKVRPRNQQKKKKRNI